MFDNGHVAIVTAVICICVEMTEFTKQDLITPPPIK